MSDHRKSTSEINYTLPTKGKYIDFFTDFGFKKLLGPPHKERLMDFLNSLLPDLGDPIVDLEYLPQEQLGDSVEDRDAIFDLYCKTESGEYCIVEMQNSRQQNFKDRLVYYSTFPVQEQARRGSWDFFLYPVYSIALLNFVMGDGTTEADEIISAGKITNIKTGKVMYDKLTYVFIEMPKFTKDLDEISAHVEKWLYLMGNLATLEEVPMGLREEVFMEFLDEAEIAKLNKDERMAYHRSLKAYRDRINTEEYARLTGLREGIEQGKAIGIEQGIEQGKAIGIEQGIEQGKASRNREMAITMLKKGMDSVTIMELTGLTASELSELEK